MGPFALAGMLRLSFLEPLYGIREKTEGIEGVRLYGESLSSRPFGSLKPAVVATNPLNFAIADTCICTNLDKSHNVHTSGGEYEG